MLSRLEEERRDLTQSSREFTATKQAELAEVKGKFNRLEAIYIAGDIERESFLRMKNDFLSQKKSLQEALDKFEDTPNAWLEPFREWIETAQNMGEIATSGTFSQKKVHAIKVFGSNLFLDSKKARGEALKPWSNLLSPEFLGEMVPAEGVEPTHPHGY
jgi:hypothetical protein